MNTRYVPHSEDFDNFSFAASQRIEDILAGELDWDAFGDVETAQITLRGAVQSGLDFKAAVESPSSVDPNLVKLQASQQVLIRLRKFSDAAARAAAARPLCTIYSYHWHAWLWKNDYWSISREKHLARFL